MEVLQTHSYDGRLVLDRDLLVPVSSLHPKEKLRRLNILRGYLAGSARFDGVARGFFETIAGGVGKPENFDATNSIAAEDMLLLLYDAYTRRQLPDQKQTVLDEIAIQLGDMKTGPCPQGRAIRLYSLVRSLVENYEDPPAEDEDGALEPEEEGAGAGQDDLAKHCDSSDEDLFGSQPPEWVDISPAASEPATADVQRTPSESDSEAEEETEEGLSDQEFEADGVHGHGSVRDHEDADFGFVHLVPLALAPFRLAQVKRAWKADSLTLTRLGAHLG